MRQVLQDIEPYPNPQPPRNEGGDCFACATKAAFDHMFPDDPPDFDTVYDWWINDKGSMQNTWIGVKTALRAASNDGYRVTYFGDIVQPSYDPERFAHDWFYKEPTTPYARRLEAWLAAGWVTFSHFRIDGEGPLTDDLKLRHGNHFVLLDGVRVYWEEQDLDSVEGTHRHKTRDVHVVDSSRRYDPHTRWVNIRDLLRKHGCAAWWLVRPKERSS